MTIGERIKKIRTHRGMTQKELGLAVGFDEKSADTRIAQYECDYRVPKRALLDKIAIALHVNRQNLYTEVPGSAEAIMRDFFWLEEDRFGSIRLFSLLRNPYHQAKSVLPDLNVRKSNNVSGIDLIAKYDDHEEWPEREPVGIYFDYPSVDVFMHEWLLRQQEFRSKAITRREYFDWKLNWPYTCDAERGNPGFIEWRENT